MLIWLIQSRRSRCPECTCTQGRNDPCDHPRYGPPNCCSLRASAWPKSGWSSDSGRRCCGRKACAQSATHNPLRTQPLIRRNDSLRFEGCIEHGVGGQLRRLPIPTLRKRGIARPGGAPDVRASTPWPRRGSSPCRRGRPHAPIERIPGNEGSSIRGTPDPHVPPVANDNI